MNSLWNKEMELVGSSYRSIDSIEAWSQGDLKVTAIEEYSNCRSSLSIGQVKSLPQAKNLNVDK